MRLINASSMLLETFNNPESRPPYAILSHRWTDGEEVTLEDMQRTHRQWLPAWPKIKMCCQQALADGLKYTWVDTCCIDKTSSSELSEAINSMYTWYSDADRCYVYLNDVDCVQYEKLDTTLSAYPSMPADVVRDIMASNWFTRAWTLQELIAPVEVTLYDASFRHLGSKTDFATEIEKEYAIPTEVLMNPQRLWEYPVAVRMSWAAHRRATRIEDVAYSLFGLFGVNLPLLYGEGTRSFMRLQEEIIRQTHDHSIFYWNRDVMHEEEPLDQNTSIFEQLPLLASSPTDFAKSQDVITTIDSGEVRPYAMTNVGLQIELQVCPFDLDVLLGLLNCKSKSTGFQYGILVAKRGDQTNTWRRLCVREVDLVYASHPNRVKNFVWQRLYIVKGTTTGFGRCRDLHGPESLRPPVPFYGFNINAPDLIIEEVRAQRPYTLVGHYDWGIGFRVLKADHEGECFNFEYKLDIDDRFRRSHQTVLTNQTEALSALWTFTCRKFGKPNPASVGAKLSGNSQPRLEEAPGVFAMPLTSKGTAGMVIFKDPMHNIRAIKTGFDADFRPVVFIATHEAKVDSWVHGITERVRYMSLDSFDNECNRFDSCNADKEAGRRFWSLNPDYLRQQISPEIREDGSIIIDKGVYAFTSGTSARFDHWVFKPDESQYWHLNLALQKREQNGLVYWEFSMHKRADRVKLDFDLVS